MNKTYSNALKKGFKVLLFTTVFYPLSSEKNILLAGKYGEVFTQGIYDQEEALNKLRRQPSISEKEKNRELIKTLGEAKEKALVDYVARKHEKLIKELEAKIPKPSIMKIITEITSTALMMSPDPYFKGGSMLVQGVLKRYFPENPIGSALAGKIDTLTTDILELTNDLPHESVRSLEEKYVKHKRKIDNLKLKDEIEKALLNIRLEDNSYMKERLELFVINALKLPVKISIPPFDLQSTSQARALQEKIEQNSLFSNLDDRMKDSLEAIISQLCKRACTPDPNEKTSCYFWGPPACFKTSTAIEIANMLKLPYGILSTQDFSKDELEGQDRFQPNPNPGQIAQILMNPQGEFKPAKNTILIIDDLDKFNPQKNTEVYRYLNLFLDPLQKTYYNPYFNTHLNISSLIVIITANENLVPPVAPQSLLSRLKMVEFFQPSNLVMETVGNGIIQEKVKSSSILKKHFSLTYKYPSTLEGTYHFSQDMHNTIRPVITQLSQEISGVRGVTFSLDIGPNIDMRQLRSGRLSDYLASFENKLTRLSRNYLQRAKNGQAIGPLNSQQVYMLSAVCGHEEAAFELAQQQNATQEEKLFWLKEAANGGLAQAQYSLGQKYGNGEDVPKNEQEAVNWYRKAAEQEHADAQFMLGVCYGFGRGISKDDEKAVEWYQKAAKQGDKTAQFNLGVHYETGRGVPKDNKKAVEWYQKAAEQGHEKAKNALKRLTK